MAALGGKDGQTLKVGEIHETALQFGVSSGGFHGAAFGSNGDNNRGGRERISGYGGVVGYSMKSEGTELGLNLSYITDIGDSDNHIVGSRAGTAP